MCCWEEGGGILSSESLFWDIESLVLGFTVLLLAVLSPE